MELSVKLKNIREEKGITQNEVSKYLNITRSAYANYEQGTREPSIKTLKLLARYFNISMDELTE